ncbi:MAG: penicillin-binding protein 2, partial [Actinomycetota bacterium]
MTQDGLRTRMKALAMVVAILFSALFTRLWFLQVLAAEQYQERAEGNRVRLIPLPAPRGRVLDRDGEALVSNRSSLVLTIERQEVENEEQVIFDLAQALDIPAAVLVRRLNDPRYLPYQPIPLLEDAPEQVIAWVAEHGREFPGVSYEVAAVRN